jgi:hypothetical protein
MMELLDPTLEAVPQDLAYAPRPSSLQGKRIGLIDNTKFNSDRLLQKIADRLKLGYGVSETHLWRKKNASVPAHEAIISEIRGTCDAAVAGIGD